MTTVEVFAPAKINLTLHVTGQRADGYHLLDSLVSFGTMGDSLRLYSGNTLSLTVEGPEAGDVPADMDNLALRAASLVPRHDEGAALVLDKHLPVASGIGGGSADAAAAYRGMLALCDQTATLLAAASDDVLAPDARALLRLGADVPMCLVSSPLRARGIGEKMGIVSLPRLPVVLINPRKAVPTPKVFAALGQKDNPPMPDPLPEFADVSTTIDWLAGMRNDLEAPAMEVEPSIAAVLDSLRQTAGCRLARMSGSGATCFGLFETEDEAKAAASLLFDKHPDWWVAGGSLADQSVAARPRTI